MRFRNLRIAWSVMSGIACVLIFALWLRGHWARDQLFVRYSASQFLWIVSERNTLSFVPRPASNAPVAPHSRWIFKTARTSAKKSTVGYPDRYGQLPSDSWLRVFYFSNRMEAHVPHWMLIAFFSIVGLIPWLPFKRYSLRTLLIATTLVAALLGIIVYAMR